MSSVCDGTHTDAPTVGPTAALSIVRTAAGWATAIDPVTCDRSERSDLPRRKVKGPRRLPTQRPEIPRYVRSLRKLDRVTDVAENRGDLAAQENEGDDRDDRDEREDQRVLGETLALVLTTE